MASPCELSLRPFSCGVGKVHLNHKVLWESFYNQSTLVHVLSPQRAGQRSKPKIGLNGLSTGKAPRVLVLLFAGAIKLSNLWPVKK